MTAMLQFIRLQLKLQYTSEKGNKKGNFISSMLSLLLFVVIMGLIYVFSDVLISSFNNVSSRDIAIIFVFVIEIVLTFAAIGLQLKHIFKPFDVKITARFPLSNTMYYISALLIVYINLLIYTVFLYLPVMIIFGIAAKLFTVEYFGLLFVSVIFIPIIPFTMSLVVSVPIMFILALLENKNYIRLILFVALIIGFFVAYDYILNLLADYFIYKQLDASTANVWVSIMHSLNSIYNPFFHVKEMLFIDSILKSIGITILCGIILSIIGFSISIPVYKYIRKSTLEGVSSIFNRRTNLTNDSVFVAMVKKEFKEIIRTKVYSYFYLGVAIATPVMVFFCDRLVVSVGEAQLGTSVAMGASVLVISSFMTLINAFSASAINKEAERFYITKIVPVSFTNQLLIKGFLSFMISMGALIISCFVIAVLKFVKIEEMFVILTSEMILALSVIFTGFNLNLKHVKFNSRSNGDVDESNVTIVMVIGILISALLAVATIFTCFFVDSRYSYILIYLLPIILLIINVSVFAVTAEKKYYNIEPR